MNGHTIDCAVTWCRCETPKTRAPRAHGPHLPTFRLVIEKRGRVVQTATVMLSAATEEGAWRVWEGCGDEEDYDDYWPVELRNPQGAVVWARS